ncbi:MAG TPA: helix-turn-helix domain-containing protein [Pyrinomonadaceae bacterium]|nr:helix-turn-helix domain-containing protein [Pyrinomonadaceae bacterium]
MRYWEQSPSLPLAEHVECFWFVTGENESSIKPEPERIFPDGCIEWIFHLADPFQRSALSGNWETQPRSFIVGQLTRFLLLQPTGRVEIMGVRFKPGGAYRFLPLPLDCLTDQNVTTRDVWGRSGAYLEGAVFDASDNVKRQLLVEEFLLGQLQKTTPRLRLEAAVAEVRRSRGQTRINDLAQRLDVSSRQLEREFRSGIGLSPKALARTIRFQNLLRLVGEGVLREWAHVALESGYSDQPHMVREFREFAGQSPNERDVSASGQFGAHFISPQRLATLLGPS